MTSNAYRSATAHRKDDSFGEAFRVLTTKCFRIATSRTRGHGMNVSRQGKIGHPSRSSASRKNNWIYGLYNPIRGQVPRCFCLFLCSLRLCWGSSFLLGILVTISTEAYYFCNCRLRFYQYIVKILERWFKDHRRCSSRAVSQNLRYFVNSILTITEFI